MAATLIDFSTRVAKPPKVERGKRPPKEMTKRWQYRERLLEAAHHDHWAAVNRRNAAATLHGEETPGHARLEAVVTATRAAELAAMLDLMLTPVTSATGLKWKQARQRRLWKDRETWLPVLIEDAERVGVDPATIVEQPTKAEVEVAEMRRCVVEGLRLVAAKHQDPRVAGRAASMIEGLEA